MFDWVDVFVAVYDGLCPFGENMSVNSKIKDSRLLFFIALLFNIV